MFFNKNMYQIFVVINREILIGMYGNDISDHCDVFAQTINQLTDQNIQFDLNNAISNSYTLLKSIHVMNDNRRQRIPISCILISQSQPLGKVIGMVVIVDVSRLSYGDDTPILILDGQLRQARIHKPNHRVLGHYFVPTSIGIRGITYLASLVLNRQPVNKPTLLISKINNNQGISLGEWHISIWDNPDDAYKHADTTITNSKVNTSVYLLQATNVTYDNLCMYNWMRGIRASELSKKRIVIEDDIVYALSFDVTRSTVFSNNTKLYFVCLPTGISDLSDNDRLVILETRVKELDDMINTK